MDHCIQQETESFQSSSHQQSVSNRRIALDIYYTSILRDPTMMNSQTQIIKKQFILNQDCFILSHKEDAKIKISWDKKQVAYLIGKEGFELIAQVKFEVKQDGKSSFLLQRNIDVAVLGDYTWIKNVFSKDQITDLNSLVFYSVKSGRQSNQSQQLKSNDYIKLGKQVYQVKIYLENSDKVRMADLFRLTQKIHKQQKHSDVQCKVCLMNQGQSKKDYIVSPCKCSGSCSSIHIECLKHWISQKVSVGKGDKKLRTYNMSKFSCQICREKYPQKIQIETSIADITPEVDITKDTLVLKKIFPFDQENKILHFVNLQKGKQLSIGRNYMNDLVLDQMSISRNHGSIYKSQNQKYYLWDKDSRFGSFINLKRAIKDLNDATLLTSKQTFRFKLIEQEPKNSLSQMYENSDLTQEKIE